jgi:hypothetical protein
VWRKKKTQKTQKTQKKLEKTSTHWNKWFGRPLGIVD